MLSVLATPYVPFLAVDNYSSSNQLSIVKRLEHDLLLFFLLLAFVYIGSRWSIVRRGNRHV